MVALRLQPLLSQIAFVGGCATQLLITDPAAPPMRVTDDVDVIAELSSYVEYTKFSKLLRKLGFTEDSSEGAPICRWTLTGAKLDVMPTDERILGFSNKWFKSALSHAALTTFEGLEVRVVPPLTFSPPSSLRIKGGVRETFTPARTLRTSSH